MADLSKYILKNPYKLYQTKIRKIASRNTLKKIAAQMVKTDAIADRQCSNTLVTKQSLRMAAYRSTCFIMVAFEVIFRIWRVNLHFLVKK